MSDQAPPESEKPGDTAGEGTPRGDSAADDRPLQHVGRGKKIRFGLTALLRILLAVALVLLVYANLPDLTLKDSRAIIIAICLAFGLWLAVVLRNMVVLQRTAHPMIRLGESVVISLLLLVVIFAQIYYMMSAHSVGALNEALDKTAALYFSMTVTTTTGFGDIVAESGTARQVVTAQMFIDLMVVGLAVRGLVSAAQTNSAVRKMTNK